MSIYGWARRDGGGGSCRAASCIYKLNGILDFFLDDKSIKQPAEATQPNTNENQTEENGRKTRTKVKHAKTKQSHKRIQTVKWMKIDSAEYLHFAPFWSYLAPDFLSLSITTLSN